MSELRYLVCPSWNTRTIAESRQATCSKCDMKVAVAPSSEYLFTEENNVEILCPTHAVDAMAEHEEYTIKNAWEHEDE